MGDIRSAGPPAVQRLGEDADADAQQEVELAMIQIKAETLKRIDAALERIESGGYGDCVSCGDEIPKNRLKALPFAVRCTACEHERERGDAIERQGARDRAGAPVFTPGTRY
jgi:DnaK suppressor protein